MPSLRESAEYNSSNNSSMHGIQHPATNTTGLHTTRVPP